MPPKATPPRKKKKTQRQSKSLMTFNVIAIAVVAAMIVGTLGVAVFSDPFSGGGGDDDTITLDQDDTDEIEQQYRDAVAANPSDTSALVTLGNYLGLVGKDEEAISTYQQAVDLAPNDSAVRTSFATSLARMGKQADAELQFQKAIEADPSNGTAMLGLARLYRDWLPPRTEDAITWYQTTIQKSADTLSANLASEELAAMTATPVASPQASPGASPAASPSPS